VGEPDSRPDAEGPGEPGTDDDEPVLRSTRLPPATAALRTSVEDQQARTHELREALDELRTTLDAGAGGLPSSTGTAAPRTDRGPRSRRVLVLLGTGAVVVAIGVSLVVAQRSSRTATGVSPSASGPVSATASPSGTTASAGPSPSGSGPALSASATATGAATPSTSPTVTTPAPATQPMAWPGGPVLDPPGLPTAGPGADVPGLELTAAIDPDQRHVDVYERIVLRPGATSLHLAPTGMGSLPRVLRGARPTVADLQVEIDGQAVRAVGGRTGWQVAPPSGSPIGHVTLRYRVAGAFVRQTPAPPGRVTLILRPLGGGAVAATDDPAVVRISDQRVGTVACPTARRPLCAVTSGRTHTATIPDGANAIVLAQVNLA
jgi:hypothetical protein